MGGEWYIDDYTAYPFPSQGADIEEVEGELEAIPESPKTDTPSIQVRLSQCSVVCIIINPYTMHLLWFGNTFLGQVTSCHPQGIPHSTLSSSPSLSSNLTTWGSILRQWLSGHMIYNSVTLIPQAKHRVQ